MTKADVKRLRGALEAQTGTPVVLREQHNPDGNVTVRGTFASPVGLVTTTPPDADGAHRIALDGGGVLTLYPLPEGP